MSSGAGQAGPNPSLTIPETLGIPSALLELLCSHPLKKERESQGKRGGLLIHFVMVG